MASKPKATPCEWKSGAQAFKDFATHEGKTQSARHIKPLHWYIASRLVIEGGFDPDRITPRPPFKFETKKSKGRTRHFLSFDPSLGGVGEQVILGGLKTKNVDVVVDLDGIGPVVAVSCKGVTKSFRNLTNRMEETIGECTNLHITYPAMVIGYFAVLRANRTIQDVIDAPKVEEEAARDEDAEPETPTSIEVATPRQIQAMKKNDIAILPDESPVDSIVRFHDALSEMTGRRGIRDEISRYEAMTIALIEPKGAEAGTVFQAFPKSGSSLLLSSFFRTLYQRYEERFVLGAPLLAERGITPRYEWDEDSPIFLRDSAEAASWPDLEYSPRLAST